jgi:hypothetical protein
MDNHIQELYQQKKALDNKWEQEHKSEGRYTLNMVKIDNKVKELINHIKMAEAKAAHNPASEVSVAP